MTISADEIAAQRLEQALRTLRTAVSGCVGAGFKPAQLWREVVSEVSTVPAMRDYSPWRNRAD